MIQTRPILAGEFGETLTTRDRALLGPGRTLRPTYSLREALDGRMIKMRIAWLQAADLWAQDLRTSSGDVIRMGVPLVASGVDLWATVQFDARMPGGQLWTAWGDLTPRRPLRDDFREGATLYYRPAELVALARGTDRELF
jgi:hypothetical protein